MSREAVRLVITAIGDPDGYKKVKYVIGESEFENAFSSLSLVEAIGAERLVVVAGLSLFKKINADFQTAEFSDLASAVEKYVRDWIAKNTKFDSAKIDVIVAPNVYGKTLYAKERRDPYFAYTYYELLRRLEECKGRKLELYVDTTHGINYMPLLLTEALRLTASVYTIVHSGRGKAETQIYVYNAEPFEPGVERLHFMLLWREIITPAVAVTRITEFFQRDDNKSYVVKLTNKLNASGGNVDDLRGKCGDVLDDIFKAGRALYGGLYLYLYTKVECYNRYVKRLEDVLKSVELEKDKSGGGGYMYVKYPEPTAARLHALLYSIVQWLKPLEGHKTPDAAAPALSTKEIKRLLDLAPSEIIKTIIRHELDLIEKSSVPTEPTLWAEVKNKDKGHECKVNRRNIYAHGGLNEYAIFVYKRGEEIYLTYGKCLKEIERHL
ncbi:MAG: CRISPR-associated CARF protein Csx1 [Pyrobaculum sp.]